MSAQTSEAKPPLEGNDAVAVIGMGCRFPGHVDSPEAYWRLLRGGIDAIGEIPEDRWNLNEYFDRDPQTPGKIYVRHGGFLDNTAGFDASFFGITPREAADLDPQQRLLLELAWESLEDAGIAPRSLRGSEAGIFVGMSSDDFAANQWSDNGLTEIETYTTLGIARSMAAGRIAYLLDLHGPVVQLDTSCSSSLVSIYQACQSLRAGACDLAIAGGVNMILSPATMVALCRLSVLAPDGKCKTFDASADGYVRGEGGGLVTLKRWRDAVRDNDRILATIQAAAVNHDGASPTLTTPSQSAQQALMRKALDDAGLSGRDVTYVEAHGTGTRVGDPIELEALDAIYGTGSSRIDPLYVGAVKTNIGHLEAAAGIAGFMKVVLMLQHREIPPHLHFTSPNPDIPWDDIPLRVPTRTAPWPVNDSRGLAAVSAFGISGTNAHVILQAAAPLRNGHLASSIPSLIPAPTASATGAEQPIAEGGLASQPPLHLLTLSARSPEALVALATSYATHLAAHPHQSLHDVCLTAATGRDHFAYRLAAVVVSRDDLIATLRAFSSGEASAAIIGDRPTDAARRAKTGFLFTGQGTQYPGMARDLYEAHPVFRAVIDRCDAALRCCSDLALVNLLYGGPEAEPALASTEQTQPALFCLQLALVELWKSWGVHPDVVLGHSVGEYAAAVVAGVFDLETGLALVANRGRLMGQLPGHGAMAVVMASEERVRSAMEVFGADLSIASINGPATIVISGKRAAIEQVLARLTSEGIDVERLDTSHAGHSVLVEPVLEPFQAVAAKFAYERPHLDMISNVSGEVAGEEVAKASYWVRHIRSPVQFAAGMQAIADHGARTFIEIGPNPNLLAMGMSCVPRLRPRPHWVPSLAKDRGGWETMLFSLAELYVRGAEIDWQGFYRPFHGNRVSLPTYAFQRQSFPTSRGRSVPSRNGASVGAPFPHPPAVAAQIAHLQAGLEDESRRLTPQLDAVAVRFVIEAFQQLGLDWRVGAELAEAERNASIPREHQAKVTRILRRLVEQGWMSCVDDRYRVTRAAPDESAQTLLAAILNDSGGPECELLGRAGPVLAAIWQGRADPLSILFPDGATDSAVTFYSEAKLLAGYNKLAGAALRAALAMLPPERTVRVLEVGAGTGGLTTHLLPCLPSDRYDYVFTDLSPLFLHAARQRFGEFAGLQTALLDIRRSPTEQGIAPHSFDLVVAANVLHATPCLRDTLGHVQQVLKPGGWLLLLEGANPPFWGDMVFTLIDGWWSFEDTDLRPDYPLMRREGWCKVLAQTGFGDVVSLQDAHLRDDSSNTLLLAQYRVRQTLSSHPPQVNGPPTNADVTSVEAAGSAADGPHASTPPLHGSGDNGPSCAADATPEPVATAGETHEAVADSSQLSSLVLTHAARVMRMNPDQIDPAQPLSELGLDSLMATELRGQLGQALQRELSMNTLQMRRSVNEITEYVRDEQSRHDALLAASDVVAAGLEVATPRAHLVPLQPKGTKTPLFFVPAGYGDLFAFQDIAHAVGTNQPVYGLQPASASRMKTFRQMSVHRLVSAYIDEIKKVQQEGPFLLSGYSAGGIIVVELARELKRQGNDVDLLAIFDPPSHVPFWLDWFYVFNYHLFSTTRLIRLVRRLNSRWARRLFHTVLDEGLRTHSAVIREHHIAPYPGRITHFRSTLSQSSLVSMRPMGWFWRRVAADGTEVHWIPGTHYGLLRGSGASVVVDELRDCLQRAAALDKHRCSTHEKGELP